MFKSCLIKLAYLLCRGHQTFIVLQGQNACAAYASKTSEFYIDLKYMYILYIYNPFLLLLNVPQILKTSKNKHPSPISEKFRLANLIFNWSPLENNFKIKLPFPLIQKLVHPGVFIIRVRPIFFSFCILGRLISYQGPLRKPIFGNILLALYKET